MSGVQFGTTSLICSMSARRTNSVERIGRLEIYNSLHVSFSRPKRETWLYSEFTFNLVKVLNTFFYLLGRRSDVSQGHEYFEAFS